MIEILVSKANNSTDSANLIYESDNTSDKAIIFHTITEALTYIKESRLRCQSKSVQTEQFTIKLAPGTYYEKVEITESDISITGLGSSPSDTIISFDDCATSLMEDGSKRGTFRSYTCLIDASNIEMSNLTIANTSGDEHIAGQAIALYADGDHITLDNCHLLGRQDTLFTGPLPPKEIQPGGFIGPKQYAPRINGHQYYRNCYICGNIDFIFGSATAYFENCTIESLSHGQDEVQGYVTAPSTPEGQDYGYVFKSCIFTSKECQDKTVYLGRPWRDYAKAIFIDCFLGPHIKDEGFHDWNKTLAREESFFAVYGCKKANELPFSASAPFARVLDEKNISKYYDKDTILNS